MIVCCNGSGLMGPRLTLLVPRLQGSLPVDHLAPPLRLPATAKPLASLLLPVAVPIVLYHTFLPSSLIPRVAPRARRIRRHATRIAHATHIRAPEYTKPASQFQRLFDRTRKWAGSECGRRFSSWVVRPRTTSPGGSGRHRIADALTICHRQSDVETIPPCKLALSGTAALSSTPTGRKLALFHTAGPPPFGRIGRAHQSPACSDAVRRFLGSVKCEV